MVIGNVSPLPKPVIVIDVAAIQMFGAAAAPRMPTVSGTNASA